jgi:hypothetical protein
LEVAEEIVRSVELAFQAGFVTHEMFAFVADGDASSADLVVEFRGAGSESGMELIEMFEVVR